MKSASRSRLNRIPAPWSSVQRGLTLIELLVSMVILGFVMALVSEAVYQVSQVARSANAATLAMSSRWAAGWSLSELFANAVSPDLPSTTPVFQGAPSRVSGFSTTPIDGTEFGIKPFELALRRDTADPGYTAVYATRGTPESITSSEAVVARLPGKAEFAFLRRNGELLAEWPPLGRTELDTEDLPRAVLVRDAETGRHLVWYVCPGEPSRPRQIRNPFEATP